LTVNRLAQPTRATHPVCSFPGAERKTRRLVESLVPADIRETSRPSKAGSDEDGSDTV